MHTNLIQDKEVVARILEAQCLFYDPDKVVALEVWPFLTRLRLTLKQPPGYVTVDIEGRHLPVDAFMCTNCGMTYKDNPHKCSRCVVGVPKLVWGFRPKPEMGTQSPRLWRFENQTTEDWLAHFLPAIQPPDPDRGIPSGWRLNDLYRACRLNGGFVS